METVLVIGSTGNVGVSVVIGALKSKRNVLAVVRNQDSAEKLFRLVGTKEGITTVEADVLSEHGVEEVVKKVKAGELPAFQHVYAAVGSLVLKSPLQTVDTATYYKAMDTAVGSTFFAYRATIPYLIEQGNPNTTWTLVTGGAGETGFAGVTAIGQGALFSLANVACLENANTNIRFNEVYLCARVEYDESFKQEVSYDRSRASEFAKVYEGILANKDIDACRVTVVGPQDMTELKYQKKLKPPQEGVKNRLESSNEKYQAYEKTNANI